MKSLYVHNVWLLPVGCCNMHVTCMNSATYIICKLTC